MRLSIRLYFNHHVERVAWWVADHLPKKVRQLVLVNACNAAQWQEYRYGGATFDPDKPTFKELYDHA